LNTLFYEPHAYITNFARSYSNARQTRLFFKVLQRNGKKLQREKISSLITNKFAINCLIKFSLD